MPTWLKNNFAPVANTLRLMRARHKHKTVRFKVGDMRRFYAELREHSIPYVVLRWLDEVPLDTQNPAKLDLDIDHLIDRNAIAKIKELASKNPGRAKCDFYSVNGERGSAYRGLPYMPPAFATEVLAHRELRPDGVFAPDARHLFLAFAFHLVYHKGTECGIDTGLAGVTPHTHAKRDYAAELKRTAAACDIPLPTHLTLLNLHELLQSHNWNMPLDLMVRWPNQHSVLKALAANEEAKYAPLLPACADLNIFVLRSDCVGAESIALATRMIKERFTVLDFIELDPQQVRALSRQTRGGNWIEKKQIEPISPTNLFVCKQAQNPGPLPPNMSAAKIAKRYPHVTHTDILIKRNIRDAVNDLLGGAAKRIVLHATDNPAEAAEALVALKGEAVQEYLNAIRAN